jgi:cysteinyl-tRNA synthetase
MSMKYLGETFDIHCGGVDNIFPHHENEIAQSEGATGKKFVNYWLHNEHLLVEGKRMAKRYGNYFTLRDLLAREYNPRAIRYLLLSTNYRQQFNFTFEGLESAQSTIERLSNFMHRLQDTDGESRGDKINQLMKHVQRCVGEAMDDDLNVSVALASLFDFVREVNNLIDANRVSKEEAEIVFSFLAGFDEVLGVVGEIKKDNTLPQKAEELIRKREEARQMKDWKTADRIRQQLKDMGIIIEDTARGVRWRIEKH